MKKILVIDDEEWLLEMIQLALRQRGYEVIEANNGHSGIERARAEVGEGAPAIDKIRPFSANPKFLEAMTDRVRVALEELPEGRIVFTAHSVPLSMAQSSPYVQELERACAAVAAAVGCAWAGGAGGRAGESCSRSGAWVAVTGAGADGAGPRSPCAADRRLPNT